MNNLNRILSGISFCLFVLLLFFTLFYNKLHIPGLLQVIGRGHLLFLHLPIGLMVLLSVLGFVLSGDQQRIFSFILNCGAFFALASAVLGILLSKETGYVASQISDHRWWGIAAAIVMYGLTFLDSEKSYSKGFLLLGMVVLAIASHQGATITHGEGFLTAPITKTGDNYTIDENKSFYLNAIQPIFEKKCISCHNPQKLKGELDLTSGMTVIQGGKHGSILHSPDSTACNLLKQISLPEDDKLHMPPAGKTQLSDQEKQLIKLWVAHGSDIQKLWNEYSPADSFIILANAVYKKAETKLYDFPAADPHLISSLNDPYTTIAPLDIHSPALGADFFVRAKYNPDKLKELQKVKVQLVELNMNNMPVKDAEVSNIVLFSNLEKIILNNSEITDQVVNEFTKLPKLRSLALAGSNITAASIPILNKSKSLQEIYVWNTSITQNDLDTVTKIKYYVGYKPDSNEIQSLNAPMILNENVILESGDSVRITHRIPGVTIRYTTNDSLPDSLSSEVYTKPVPILNHTTIKAIALKSGWKKSPVATFSLFKKGIQPQQVRLLTLTNEKYRSSGGNALINNVKGNIGNLIDGNWLGFKENPMVALFELDQAIPVHHMVLSYNENVGAYIVPPVSIEVLEGNDTIQMKSIKKIILPPLNEKDKGAYRNGTVDIALPGIKSKYIKLIAINNQSLPKWHGGKGQKGWLFVDEVFFY